MFLLINLIHIVIPARLNYKSRRRSFRDMNLYSKLKTVLHKVAENKWEVDAERGLKFRVYNSADDYRTHQRLKFDMMAAKGSPFTKAVILSYRWKFFRRFINLVGRLPQNSKIYCLGARQGTEVEVLRDLGFRNALGLDLNPGPGNPLVLPADFMRLPLADGSCDLIYTNCVDHVPHLSEFLVEQCRALRRDGFLLLDITLQADAGAFEAAAWERAEQILISALGHFDCLVMAKREKQWLWALLSRPRGKT